MMPKALVLGGYGLIGSASVKALADAFFGVTGLGQSRLAAPGFNPQATLVIRSILLIMPGEWPGLLTGGYLGVNAAEGRRLPLPT